MGIDVIIKLLIRIGMLALAVTALSVFGSVINNFLPWSWLITFFALIRNLLYMMNWLVDIPTLLQIIGYVMLIEIAYWGYEGTMVVIKFFKHS